MTKTRAQQAERNANVRLADSDMTHQPSVRRRSSGLGGVKGAILARLDEFERLFVVLYYAEHMSPHEIAEALEIEVAEVREVHRHVLRKLRDSVSVAHAA